MLFLFNLIKILFFFFFIYLLYQIIKTFLFVRKHSPMQGEKKEQPRRSVKQSSEDKVIELDKNQYKVE